MADDVNEGIENALNVSVYHRKQWEHEERIEDHNF
jgi:hypothetical protein